MLLERCSTVCSTVCLPPPAQVEFEIEREYRTKDEREYRTLTATTHAT